MAPRKHLIFAAIGCLAFAGPVYATETENLGISVLPAPGASGRRRQVRRLGPVGRYLHLRRRGEHA